MSDWVKWVLVAPIVGATVIAIMTNAMFLESTVVTRLLGMFVWGVSAWFMTLFMSLMTPRE